jgi:hypothetical protein
MYVKLKPFHCPFVAIFCRCMHFPAKLFLWVKLHVKMKMKMKMKISCMLRKD